MGKKGGDKIEKGNFTTTIVYILFENLVLLTQCIYIRAIPNIPRLYVVHLTVPTVTTGPSHHVTPGLLKQPSHNTFPLALLQLNVHTAARELFIFSVQFRRLYCLKPSDGFQFYL